MFHSDFLLFLPRQSVGKRTKTKPISQTSQNREIVPDRAEKLFFWKPYGDNGIFSQWFVNGYHCRALLYLTEWCRYMCQFIVENITYNCAEQYMMAEKARLFGDDEALSYIMKSHEAHEQQQFGRIVKHFDKKIWNDHARDIVYRGNMAKFSQNIHLRDQLLATGTSEFVEASPMDRIWGIGLKATDPAANDKKKWRGTNWLGKVLVRVRQSLQGASGASMTHTKSVTSAKLEMKSILHRISTSHAMSAREKHKKTIMNSSPALSAMVKKYRLRIKCHACYPHLIQLFYSQVASPLGVPLVQECRGIILEKLTPNSEVDSQNSQSDKGDRKNRLLPDWKIISLPFFKVNTCYTY